MEKVKLFVLSAPSGCGKTTIAREILKIHPELNFSVSVTTRQKRNTEIHGRDYYFVSEKEFEEYIQQGELVEWQKIYGNYYGTLKAEIEKSLINGKSMIFDIDVLGAISIKKKFPNKTILIFIDVPNAEILKERLRKRQTEDIETFNKRINRIDMEFDQKKHFDFVVVNDNLQKAIEEVDYIITKQLTNKKEI